MALAVAQTLREGGALVAEAATGVGKTFAYLAPVLLGGERALLSTATKTLQDQLYGRDLPRLIGALGLPVRTALLKGRSSYLCPYRLELARHEAPASAAAARELARIERWAQATATGDLAELPELDERSPVIPLVTSTRDNCLGSECPRFRDCHVARARREALAADVVVINHHLFFADLAIRESGMAELLPAARAVVFDEAHQLNETGIQFLGRQLGHRQLQDFARDCLPPVCSTRAACKTGARWLAALRTLCAICGWPLAIRLPARPAAMPACAGTLSRPKACLKQAGWPPWPACKPRWSPLPPLAKPCKTPPPTFPACSPAPSAWPGWPRTLPSPPRRMRPAGWKWAFTPCN